MSNPYPTPPSEETVEYLRHILYKEARNTFEQEYMNIRDYNRICMVFHDLEPNGLAALLAICSGVFADITAEEEAER